MALEQERPKDLVPHDFETSEIPEGQLLVMIDHSSFTKPKSAPYIETTPAVQEGDLTGAGILALLEIPDIYSATTVDNLLGEKVDVDTGYSLLIDSEIERLLTLSTPYTITLQAGADLATKIANSTETTDYPPGWVLEAVDTVNLKITHGLAKRFTGLSVFGKVGAVETMLRPWSEAYTNVIAETTSILKIYGIDPVNEITIIDLNFKA
jgi:hypothetical protein